MIAAGHTGVNASSRLHRGRGHYLNPRKNRRLEHEINIARQTGADYRDDALASAETQLASAKAILDGEVT